jgi:hypothetical protein
MQLNMHESLTVISFEYSKILNVFLAHGGIFSVCVCQ